MTNRKHRIMDTANKKEALDRAALIIQIKRHEGEVRNSDNRHCFYECPAGKKTIGYGLHVAAHDISTSQTREWERHGMGDNEAHNWLFKTIAETEAALNKARGHKAYWAKLSAPRVCAIINLAFNIGIGGIRDFRRMWAALENGDYDKAAAEMLDSKWAKQVGSRATELAEQMRSGKWDTRDKPNVQAPAKASQKGFCLTKTLIFIAVSLAGFMLSLVV